MIMPFDFPHGIIQYIIDMAIECDKSICGSQRLVVCRFWDLSLRTSA